VLITQGHKVYTIRVFTLCFADDRFHCALELMDYFTSVFTWL